MRFVRSGASASAYLNVCRREAAAVEGGPRIWSTNRWCGISPAPGRDISGEVTGTVTKMLFSFCFDVRDATVTLFFFFLCDDVARFASDDSR